MSSQPPSADIMFACTMSQRKAAPKNQKKKYEEKNSAAKSWMDAEAGAAP